jgi:hypothetical protein
MPDEVSHEVQITLSARRRSKEEESKTGWNEDFENECKSGLTEMTVSWRVEKDEARPARKKE